MPFRPAAAPLATALALSFAAAPALASEAPLRVVASVAMIADVAANAAGACADVSALLGPGVDPHDYVATPGDVRKLAGAELILYVDAALEERLADVLAGLAGRVPVLGLGQAAFGPDDLLEDPDAPGMMDPHLWMDVSRWARIAPVIVAEVGRLRPDCAPAMEADLAAHMAELAALHDWVRAAIASIPDGARVLVTAHDAFAYFADAYGMEASEAIAGISTAAEASLADIREVADFVIAEGVPAVFVESTVNPRTIQALVAEVRARGHALEIGGELFSDAMGAEGTPEGTYIGMIRANTATIVTALGGSLPDWPEALAGWAEAQGLAD